MLTRELAKWMFVCILGLVVGAALGAVLLGGLPGLLLGALSAPLAGIALMRVMSHESPPTAWHHRAARFARIALMLLFAVSLYGLMAGIVVAVAWRPVLGWDNLLLQLQDGGYMLVLVLSLPSLFVGLWYALRGQWREGVQWLFPFVGPFIVFFVGQGLTPHLDGRLHQLVHTLSGSLPLTVLYYVALRKWHPSIIRAPMPAVSTST